MQFILFLKRERNSLSVRRQVKLAENIEYQMLNKRTIY
jgi:hypothetical protein